MAGIWSYRNPRSKFIDKKDFLVWSLIAGVYFYCGKLGLHFALISPQVSAVWPPTGLTLAAFLLLGRRIWPGIALGAFLVHFNASANVWVSAGIATGNTLEGLVGAFLVHRFAHGLNAFDRPQDIFKFLFFAGMISTAVSATLGTSSLCFGGLTDWKAYRHLWFTWWMGDLVSDILIASALLIWAAPLDLKRWNVRHSFEFLFLVAGLIFVSGIVFGGWFLSDKNLPIGFLLLPFLLWAGFRFGLHGGSLAALFVFVMSVRGTATHLGPFVRYDPNVSLLVVQAYTACQTLAVLVLASATAENKRVNRELQNVGLRKSAILDTSLDCIISMDAEGNIMDFNSAAEKTFRYSRNEIVGKPLADRIIPPSLREAHRQGLERYLKTGEGPVLGKKIEWVAVRSDGSEFPMEMIINEVRLGGNPLFTAYLRDITERRQAEEDRLRLAAIVESSDDAIIGKTLDGIITTWNHGAELLYGYSAAEIVGRPMSVLMPQERLDEIESLLEKLKRGESVAHLETVRVRKDRKQIHVSVTVSPIKNAAGRIIGASAIARDITEAKISEEALKDANKRLTELVQLKDEFVASVSHELRTPLTAVKEGIALILNRAVGPLNDEQEDFLKTISENSERLAELINNLLDISKIEAGKFQLSRRRVALRPLIEKLLTTYRTLLGSRTVQANFEDVPEVFADPPRIEQVLGNLLSNSIKFTKPDGRIGITVQKQYGGVAVSIEDDGVGIAPEDLPKLFKKFSQVGEKHFQGTGLGLALAKQLVEMHQGSIFVASKAGKGSKFTFTLPVYVPHIREKSEVPFG